MMGDINQLIFVKKNINRIKGPILEVGSKDYGNTQNLRPLFPYYEYIGVDMEDGPGVDVVLDLTNDLDIINKVLGYKKFKTIFCFSVLEHCSNPFKFCNNLQEILDQDGIIFISAPFSWRIHGYPSDYWRFTPEGIKILFSELKFDMNDANLTSTRFGSCEPVNDYMLRAELDISKARKRKVYSNFTIFIIRVLKKFKILPWISEHPYLFPPVNINMIGVKKQ